MKKFKLYVEVPSLLGTITYVRMDKMPEFDGIVDYNQLALHMANQNLLIKEGAKYQIFVIEMDRDKYFQLVSDISRKQKNRLGKIGYMIISDGTFPLIQILPKQRNTNEVEGSTNLSGTSETDETLSESERTTFINSLK
jgi:hypothetical protein